MQINNIFYKLLYYRYLKNILNLILRIITWLYAAIFISTVAAYDRITRTAPTILLQIAKSRIASRNTWTFGSPACTDIPNSTILCNKDEKRSVFIGVMHPHTIENMIAKKMYSLSIPEAKRY